MLPQVVSNGMRVIRDDAEDYKKLEATDDRAEPSKEQRTHSFCTRGARVVHGSVRAGTSCSDDFCMQRRYFVVRL